MSQPFNVTFNIKYGSDPCQFVNLYLPTGTIAGTILRIHGGGWNSGTEAPWPSPSAVDANMENIAGNGFAVIDGNYRGINTDKGSNGNGQFPNNVNDVKTILNYLLVSGAGASWSSSWQTMYDLQNNNGGLMVTGTSAGGHLALYAVCDYGTSSGKWPKSVACAAGPYNLSYPDVFIDPILSDNIIKRYITSESDLKTASPYYQYGTDTEPGPWFSATNSSSCKFLFTQNNHDTLTTNAISMPFITNFRTFNRTNSTSTIITVGPPQQAFPGITAVTYKGKTSDETTATLPTTGNQLGDCYLASGLYWVYNQGNYQGDSINPASINGFTRWFDHNYTIL